jgi:hypothetical protein
MSYIELSLLLIIGLLSGYYIINSSVSLRYEFDSSNYPRDTLSKENIEVAHQFENEKQALIERIEIATLIFKSTLILLSLIFLSYLIYLNFKKY